MSIRMSFTVFVLSLLVVRPASYILEAVKVLDDILRRMRGHQEKKRSMLRELHVVSAFRKERDAMPEGAR